MATRRPKRKSAKTVNYGENLENVEEVRVVFMICAGGLNLTHSGCSIHRMPDPPSDLPRRPSLARPAATLPTHLLHPLCGM
jgi:hypothetical protein